MADAPKPLNAKQVERLNAASTGTVIKWMSRINTWIFKASGGKLGNKFLRGAEVGSGWRRAMVWFAPSSIAAVPIRQSPGIEAPRKCH